MLLCCELLIQFYVIKILNSITMLTNFLSKLTYMNKIILYHFYSGIAMHTNSKIYPNIFLLKHCKMKYDAVMTWTYD